MATLEDIEAAFREAAAALRRGDLGSAERLCRAVLARSKNHLGALNLLGALLSQTGRPTEASTLMERAIAVGPPSPVTLYNHGLVLRVLRQPETALQRFDQAAQLDPSGADIWNARGSVLNELGRFEEALASFERVLALRPDSLEALVNRGNALMRLCRHHDALASYDKAIAVQPDVAAALVGRGNALLALRRPEDARVAYERACVLAPGMPQAWIGHGNALAELQGHQAAAAAYERALALDPRATEAWYGRGNLLASAKRYEPAIEAYDAALAASPHFAKAWLARCRACKAAGRWREANESIEQYLRIELPSDTQRRDEMIALGIALAGFDGIPVIYDSEEELSRCRAASEAAIGTMDRLTAAIPAGFVYPAAIREAAFCSTGFALAYHQRDDLAWSRSYSQVLTRIFGSSTQARTPASARSDGPIRLGIASELLRDHNAARWAVDWLANLPRGDYALFSYALHADNDATTARLAELGPLRRLSSRPSRFDETLDAIRADRLDCLMLPDVGMSASSRVMSQYRLAPLQFTAWGHPVTTGSPNIDFYLSSDLMEPPGAQAHYSESLVRLPGLALYLEPASLPGEPDPPFDLPRERTLYGCLQSLFKYLPRHDAIYPRIARRVPSACFVFIEDEPSYVTATMRARLVRAFAAEGLDANAYVRFLKRMEPRRFTALCGAIDIALDSIGWSGGNTTVQCLEMGRPIVTMAGAFMRGRHSDAMLRMIGVEEPIAASLDDFVALAARLGEDPGYRAQMRSAIMANCHKLHRDRAVIEALDRFLKAETMRLRASTDTGAARPA